MNRSLVLVLLFGTSELNPASQIQFMNLDIKLCYRICPLEFEFPPATNLLFTNLYLYPLTTPTHLTYGCSNLLL